MSSKAKLSLILILCAFLYGQVTCIGNEQEYVTFFEGHSGPIVGLAIFEEEDRILSAGIFDKKIVVRKLSDHSVIKVIEDHKEQVRGVTALRSGSKRYFATYGYEPIIYIWDLFTLEIVHILEAGVERTMKVFQFEGTDLMVSQQDSSSKIWNFVEGGDPEYQISNAHEAGTRQTAVISSDPLVFATVGNDHFIKVWDVKSGKALHTMKTTGGLVYSFIYVEHMDVLITGDNNGLLQSWYYKVGRNVRIYQDNGQNIILDLVVIPNSNLLVAAGHGRKDIQFFDADKDNSKPIYTKRGHTNEVWKLHYQKNSGYVFSCSADYTVKLWTICESKYDYYNLQSHKCILNCVDKDEKNQLCLSTKSGERPVEEKLKIKLPFIDTVTTEL